MKHLLINTIGNRDVQIRKENLHNLNESIRSFFEENTESPDMFVISKRISESGTFYSRSERLYLGYDEISPFLEYPLIDIAIKENGIPDKLILMVTDQERQHHLDTVFLGEILKIKLLESYEIEVEVVSIVDVHDMGFVSRFFKETIDKYIEEYRITLHTSGGIPNLRIIAFMSSLFKDNVSVVNYIGKEATEASVFKTYESHTIKQIVSKMLKNWNYSAILTLPYINSDVRNICDFTIARLALDLDKARKLSQNLNLEYPIPDQKDHVAIEKELVYSAYIKYHQREYGDFLFRMFTFHDNMLVPHVEKILDGEIVFDKRSNHALWKELIKKEVNKDIYEYLETTKVGNSPLDISQPNKTAYYKILHFCKKYSKTRNLEEKSFQVMTLFNKIGKLADLRNKIAHHYEGVNEDMILMEASLKDIMTLTKTIDRYLQISFSELSPYQEINKLILKHL